MTTVRVPRELHMQIKAAAKKDRRTIEGFVEIAMTTMLTH